MIKICRKCLSTWAGGMVCEDCGGSLTDPFAATASEFPDEVWRYIRLQYGARRGMLVRVIAILSGFVVAMLCLRKAFDLAMPARLLGFAVAVALGLAFWRLLHVAATRLVRIWVLRRGRIQRSKLVRAMLKKGTGYFFG